jgi:eukaryotic-like serine/threonine-protein kinase
VIEPVIEPVFEPEFEPANVPVVWAPTGEAGVSERIGITLQQGRYTLQSVLGSGGMATVFRAWDGMLAVERAVKVLHGPASASASIQDRFLDEARTMARLHHANLVTVHDLGADQGTVFMVMEILDGGSLSGRIVSGGPMPPADAAGMLAQALDGLQAAHAAGVVHRDIKPQNLLLDNNGVVKLTDFGIARAEGASSGHTRTGVMLGTWAYMSPEQRDDPRRVGPATDIYAMGATLYAMVTARRPVDLYVADAREARIGHLPEPLRAVLRKSTAYQAGSRYASAAEMAQALRDIVHELPVEAVPASGGMVAAEDPSNALPTIADMAPPSDIEAESFAGPHDHESLVEELSPPPPPAPVAPAADAPRVMLDPRALDSSTATHAELPTPPAPRSDRGRLVGLGLAAVIIAVLTGLWAASAFSPEPETSPAAASAPTPAVAPAALPAEVPMPVGVTAPGGIPGGIPGGSPVAGPDTPAPAGGPPAAGGGPPPPG